MTELKDAAMEYEMDGRRYGFTIPAESQADAERRMRAIRLTGTVSGWPCWRIKAPSPFAYLAMPFVALWASILNTVRR